jgi:hypothetical protein
MPCRVDHEGTRHDSKVGWLSAIGDRPSLESVGELRRWVRGRVRMCSDLGICWGLVKEIPWFCNSCFGDLVLVFCVVSSYRPVSCFVFRGEGAYFAFRAVRISPCLCLKHAFKQMTVYSNKWPICCLVFYSSFGGASCFVFGAEAAKQNDRSLRLRFKRNTFASHKPRNMKQNTKWPKKSTPTAGHGVRQISCMCVTPLLLYEGPIGPK